MSAQPSAPPTAATDAAAARQPVLATDGDRFPTSAPRLHPPAPDCRPSPARPYGLRFAGAPAAAHAGVPPWRLCPDRQIALTLDGDPWYRSVVAMSMSTTGPSTDGGGSTGGEEYRPDYTPDESAALR